MPKRSRRPRRRTRKRRKAKAKTRVDKRQDKVIRKLVLESMPEKKWYDTTLCTRIPNAWANQALGYHGYNLTGTIPVWNTETMHSNAQRTHSREGLEIVAKSLSIVGTISQPRIDQIFWNSNVLPNKTQPEWPEHFVTRLMIVRIPKPCMHNGEGPNLEDILETPKFQNTKWDPFEKGFDPVLAISPCPEYSRYRKPYTDDKFQVVYNQVIQLEGGKQNLTDHLLTVTPTGLPEDSNTPGFIPDGIEYQPTGSATRIQFPACQPTGLRSSRKHRVNIRIPINKKMVYEQNPSGDNHHPQVTNMYKMYMFACNDYSFDLPEAPLCMFEGQVRLNFVDP